MFALHAKGTWFETGRKQSSLTHAVSAVSTTENLYCHEWLFLEIRIHEMNICKTWVNPC